MEQYGIYPILQHITQQHPKLFYNFPKHLFLLPIDFLEENINELKKERKRGIYFRIALGKESPKDAHDIKQYK
jgi:hypothetical protein